MKQLTNLKADTIDAPDIPLPSLRQCGFGNGGISITAQEILVYGNMAMVSIPLSEIIRLVKEADGRVDLTPEGRKAMRDSMKAVREKKRA